MDILKKAPPPQKTKIIHSDEYGFFIRMILRYGKEKNIDFLGAVNILFMIAILIMVIALGVAFYPPNPQSGIFGKTFFEDPEHGEHN